MKVFLHLKGKKNFEGCQESVDAKAFFDWRDKMFENPGMEHIRRCIGEEYKAKIATKNSIPDTLALKKG